MNAKVLYSSVTILVSGLLTSLASPATTISINNVNAPGVGFNDPTPVTPLPSNPGTTLGAQRLYVFQKAADQWAILLNSNVPIIVQAQMSALTCTQTSGTLGQAGPVSAASNFPNAPKPNTVYNIAEANALAGSDQDPGHDDINAQFNASINGDPNCLGGASWWYGTDPAASPPPNSIPLLPVVFHELGHGLGFTSLIDSSSGSFLTSNPPVWAHYLYDTGASLLWINMTDAERQASALNDPKLVWTGARTNKQAAAYLEPGNALIINAPVALAGPHQVGTAAFGPVVPGVGIAEDLTLVNDGVAGVPTPPDPAGTVNDGCETPFANSVSGKIALIDRGFCNFTQKVKNAQNAGAIAVIIANNKVEDLRLPRDMAGSDPTITISSYSVTQKLGNEIKSQLPGVNATLGYANIGINQDCARMFAPDPVLPGSSVSHFHADASPNLLMEPALNTTNFDRVDLTLPLFADIGWSTNAEDFLFLDGFDPNPCPFVQP